MVQLRHEKGSMLIEAIVAISVFMIGFGSVLTLNAQALHIVPQISKRLIASELAQEGVEIVRNHITTNAIRGNPFNFGLSDGSYSVFSDISEGPMVGVSCGATCPTALFLPSSGLGNYTTNSSGKPTPFRRVVVTNTTKPHEVQVNSIVTWDDSIPSMTGCAASRGNCINVEDHLFDWQ
ncbi:MAG: hypothetical protein HZA36_02460 [Parcubacteria group bacterium]|nr:hypothetical protein [Parcubacteria group bacterium]